MGDFARTWRELETARAARPRGPEQLGRHEKQLASLEQKLGAVAIVDAADQQAEHDVYACFDSEVTRFFDWFRFRAANARAMLAAAPAQEFRRSLMPEFHVLLGAGIDALANHWERGYGPRVMSPGVADTELKARYSNRWRFGEFLRIHGGEHFDRVAVPDLRERARKSPALLRALDRIGGTDRHDSHVRTWQEDVPLARLIEVVREDGLAVDEAWARRSLYGEILYKHYRCVWVHEFEGSDEISNHGVSPRMTEPHYLNMLGPPDYNGNRESWRRPVFTDVFLLEAYNHAIESLERACRRHGCHPCDGKRPRGCARPS